MIAFLWKVLSCIRRTATIVPSQKTGMYHEVEGYVRSISSVLLLPSSTSYPDFPWRWSILVRVAANKP
jgi:hypothetical protein